MIREGVNCYSTTHARQRECSARNKIWIEPPASFDLPGLRGFDLDRLKCVQLRVQTAPRSEAKAMLVAKPLAFAWRHCECV